MGRLWQAWAARFATMQQREKLLVVGATVFVILFGGYTFWIEPGQLQTSRLLAAIAYQEADLQRQAGEMQNQADRPDDPDAANRRSLEQLQRQIADVTAAIRTFDSALVAPEEAHRLLQALLSRHPGLTLVGLTTLPPQPVVAVTEEPGAAGSAPVAAGGLFRHGIEIRISGSYHDLTAYLTGLENSPLKLVWGSMTLSGAYPSNELTLTVYTLSLESAWLVV